MSHPGRTSRSREEAGVAVEEERIADTIRSYLDSLADLRSPDESGDRCRTLRLLGDLYADLGDASRALGFYLDAREESEKIGDFESLALTLHSIGILYGAEGTHDRAVSTLRESLELFREIGHRGMEVRGLRNLGAVYLAAGETDRARECELRALTACDLLGDLTGSGGAMITLGEIAERRKNPEEALSYYIRAAERLEGTEDDLLLTTALLGAGRSYRDLGRYSPALQALEQGLVIAQEIGDLPLQAGFHDALQSTFRALGDYRRGLEHLQHYVDLSRRSADIERQRTIAELQMRFDLERGLKEEKIRAQHDVTQAIIETQEAERSRIAGDLHDGVGQLLATVRIHLLRLERDLETIGPKGEEIWQRSVDLLERASRDVRTISHTLSSSTLHELGLEAALAEMIADVNGSGKTRFLLEVGRDDELERVPEELRLCLFRVAQELVLNVIRHADASEAGIRLLPHEDAIVLMVEDDGCGFDPDQKRHGMGTRNIEARVEALGGLARFDSRPGRGTTVTVEIPRQ